MRVMRYRQDDIAGIAVSTDNAEWRGLPETHPDFPGDLKTLLAQARLEVAAKIVMAQGTVIEPEAVTVLPPIDAPGKTLCIGLNYRAHVVEMNMPMPEHPTVFTRYPSSFVGHGAPLVRPKASVQFDYEVELAAVIGTGGRHIAKADALDHLAGYTLFNDGSVRDVQMQTPQWTLGKNFDATGACGPWMVTADALPAGAAGLAITGRLNGEIVQSGRTDDLVFDVAELIHHLSAVMTLEPGDMIVTGTPSGVAMGQQTPRWMKPGDQFTVEVEGIGVLENPIVAEG